MAHSLPVEYPTPTLIAGSDYQFSPTASTATSNTKVSVPNLTVIATSYNIKPEVTNGTNGTLPASGAAWSGIGWETAALIPLSDPGTLLAGSATFTFSVTGTSTSMAGTFTVILYVGGVEVARATTAQTTMATTAQAVAVSLSWAQTAIPSGGKIAVDLWFTGTNSDVLNAQTITLNYGASGTNLGAGVTYSIQASRAGSDTAAAADTVARALVAARTGSDAAAGADTPARTATFPRSPTDVAAGVDAGTRQTTVSRAAAESTTVSDAATRVTTAARASADTAAAADTPARQATLGRGATDTTTITDAAARVAAHPRTGTDGASAGDVSSRTVVTFRSPIDVATVSEAPSRVINYGRFAQDGPGDYVVRFPGKAISGITRDQNGNVLGGCTVTLFRQSDNLACQVTTSDPVTGAYSFPRDLFDPNQYFVTSYKMGAPQVHGVSDRNLTPA